MSGEDPKETLLRARNIQRRIDRRKDELTRLRELREYLSATDYSAVVVKHSAGRGNVERLATSSNLERLEDLIREDVERLATAKLEAIALISLLDDPRMTEVLWEYYIHAPRNWDKAADRLYMGRRTAVRLHGQALQVLREKMALNGTGNLC